MKDIKSGLLYATSFSNKNTSFVGPVPVPTFNT